MNEEKEILELIREGYFNYSRVSTGISKDLAMVVLYNDKRIRKLKKNFKSKK